MIGWKITWDHKGGCTRLHRKHDRDRDREKNEIDESQWKDHICPLNSDMHKDDVQSSARP
jgi:hypothetical protein